MSYNVLYQDIGLKEYEVARKVQENIFKRLTDNKLNRRQRDSVNLKAENGILIFVEHPHVYTLGKSGSENNLLIDHIQLKAKEAKFFRTDRGGDITYHGPGQIVGYPIFDLEEIEISLKEYIRRLEEAVINTLLHYNITGSRLSGATGVWIDQGNRPRKICAIGVKASRYITMHGFAFNVNTDLSYFNYINPCGFVDKEVTSLEKELGAKQDFEEVKNILKTNFKGAFDLQFIN